MSWRGRRSMRTRKIGIALRKDDPALTEELNKALQADACRREL